MVFTYFHTIVFLVVVLLILNVVNRIVFMRFVKRLPVTSGELKINDVLDRNTFDRMIIKLDKSARQRAGNTRSWLIRIIISMFVVIVLIIIVGVMSYIK